MKEVNKTGEFGLKTAQYMLKWTEGSSVIQIKCEADLRKLRC